MKRSRSQGQRHILQKMHTIQSMASADETFLAFNTAFNTGSGGAPIEYSIKTI